MAKRKKRPNTAQRLKPTASRVRPGLVRALTKLLRSGQLPALLLAGCAAYALYTVLTSPRFTVHAIEADGVQALTQEDIAAFAAVQDMPIWDVDLVQVVGRVRQSPYVEQAEARLILPDRLRVSVIERKPEVRWTHGGTTYAVTWEGQILDQATPMAPGSPITATSALSPTTPITAAQGLTQSDDTRLDFVSSITIVDTTPNRTLAVGQFVDADALELARRVALRAPEELPAPITRIEWDGGLGVSLIVGEGRQVVLGRSNDLDRKMATLRFLLAENTQFTYADLRPTTPYYR